MSEPATVTLRRAAALIRARREVPSVADWLAEETAAAEAAVRDGHAPVPSPQALRVARLYLEGP